MGVRAGFARAPSFRSSTHKQKKHFGEGLKARSYKHRTKGRNKDALPRSEKAHSTKDEGRQKRKGDDAHTRSQISDRSESHHPKKRAQRADLTGASSHHKAKNNTASREVKGDLRAQLKSHGRRKEASKGHSLQSESRLKRYKKEATHKGRPSKEKPQSV